MLFVSSSLAPEGCTSTGCNDQRVRAGVAWPWPVRVSGSGTHPSRFPTDSSCQDIPCPVQPSGAMANPPVASMLCAPVETRVDPWPRRGDSRNQTGTLPKGISICLEIGPTVRPISPAKGPSMGVRLLVMQGLVICSGADPDWMQLAGGHAIRPPGSACRKSAVYRNRHHSGPVSRRRGTTLV